MAIRKDEAATSLRKYWLPGLNEVTGSPNAGLASWLAAGSYIVESAEIRKISLWIPAPDRKFVSAFASECGKFSSAALETLSHATPSENQGKALAWPAVQAYYASFFSIHALLRIFGRSVTYLDGATANKVSSISSAYLGVNALPLSSGMYAFEFDSKTSRLTGEYIGSQGSHEQVWNLFSKLIMFFSTSLVADPSTTSLHDIALSDLLKNINGVLHHSNSLSANWLSKTRNEINYQRMYGIWHPYKLPDGGRDDLHRILGTWKTTVIPEPRASMKKNELKVFAETTMAINGLLLALLKDLAMRCPKGKSFVDQLAFPVVRLLCPGLL